MRRLYCANVEDCSVAQVDISASPFSAHGCLVVPDATPSPIPTGSDLHTNQVEALTVDEVATCLSGLPLVQLSTYDFTRSALCHSQKRFEIDFKLLQDQLQAGIQQLNFIVSQMRLCESGMDKPGPPPLAQPSVVKRDPLP